jgi:cytochrome c553
MILTLTVAAAFVALMANDGRADAAAGKKAFQAGKCDGCHYTEGPAKEKTIADQLAKKGPELWYAGSKFKKDWLNKWLQNPVPIRPLAYNSLTEKNKGDHPKLTAADAASMTDFLMNLTSKDVAAGVVQAKKNPKGNQIFTQKMPCGGCHQYRDKGRVLGGLNGPALTDAGGRLNPDWILAYLQKPAVFKPVKAMPTFVGILNDGDMKSVAAHVASFTDAQ